MNTIECIKTRRSVRSYNEKPVERDLIRQVIDAAAYAPSWKNTQVTRYYVIDSAEVKEKIASDCCSFAGNCAIIRQAPVIVVTAMVKSRSGYERDGSFSSSKEKGWQMYDCGIAGQTLCLAAHEYGLSSLIMGIFDYEKVAELCNIPDTQEVCSLIALGYTDNYPEAPKRKSVDDLVTFI